MFDGGGQFVDSNEQMGGNGVAIEKTLEGLTNNDVIVEGFSGERKTTWRMVEPYLALTQLICKPCQKTKVRWHTKIWKANTQSHKPKAIN